MATDHRTLGCEPARVLRSFDERFKRSHAMQASALSLRTDAIGSTPTFPTDLRMSAMRSIGCRGAKAGLARSSTVASSTFRPSPHCEALVRKRRDFGRAARPSECLTQGGHRSLADLATRCLSSGPDQSVKSSPRNYTAPVGKRVAQMRGA